MAEKKREADQRPRLARGRLGTARSKRTYGSQSQRRAKPKPEGSSSKKRH